MRKIILLGYMGSGKSTISKLLSEKTQIKAVDLDKIIEERYNLSINQIFEQKGEIFFRKAESQIFKELLAVDNTLIISLGGGTPCYANNHELLKNKNVLSFYLKGSVEELYKRLLFSQNTRPLIANSQPEEMKEYIAKHLFDRSFYYMQANYIVAIDGKTIQEIAYEVQQKLA